MNGDCSMRSTKYYIFRYNVTISKKLIFRKLGQNISSL
jgi:hypothetical protein